VVVPDAAALRYYNPRELQKDVCFLIDYMAEYREATLDLIVAHGTDLPMLNTEDVDTDVYAFLKSGAGWKV